MNIKRPLIALLLAAICLTTSAYNDHRNTKVDSLEALLNSGKPLTDEQRLAAYDELTRGYLPFDAEKCEAYGRKAIALSYKLDDLLTRQYTLRHLGLLRYGGEEYDEALRYFQQALAVVDTMATQKRYTQKDLDDARSSLYGTIGNLYNMQDKAHLAIHYYQLALPIFERNGWLESQTVCYYNIGELYSQMGNDSEAERNYIKAIEKSAASGDSLMMAWPRKGLAETYLNRGDYNNALQMADEALAYYRAHQAEEPFNYATTLAQKARIYLMDGHKDMAKAKACIEKAQQSIPDNAMFDDVSTIYMAACEVAMAEGRWQEALGYGLRSIHPDSTATYSDKDGYVLLAQIYAELGQKEKAREYISKAYDMMNRYATDHYQSGLSQMEVLYETEKKEAQIATLDKERALYRWLLVAAIIAIAALVAGTVLMVIVQRRKKALLAAKVALETETKERQILARDLHDGLGSMLSVLRMKSLSPNPSPKGEGNEYIQLIDKIIVELRRTAHHLMPKELLRNGLVSALNDFAISVPGATFQFIQADGVTVPLSDEIPLAFRRGVRGEAIELVLYRCAYELVNNTIKHAQATHIDIQLMQEPKQVTLTVSDDGKGMAEESNGMGLQNIRERIEPYKGRLDIITAEGKGTDINITLPL